MENVVGLWNPMTTSRIILSANLISELSIPSSPTGGSGGGKKKPAPLQALTIQRCTDAGAMAPFRDLTGVDLNSPPRNWLSRDSHTPLAVQSASPGSLVDPDMVAARTLLSEPHDEDCDFIASTEALHQLFAVPVAPPSTPLALTLHKVGKAIVIDNGGTLQGNQRPSRTVRENHERAMRSKMLYYSVLAGIEHSSCEDPSSNPPPPEPSHVYPRAIHWRFQDLQLLIGSRAPILGDMTVRLHPSGQPLSSVDAVEAWLDNVLTNVSHVALCFHTDGVIQGYQVVSTQDIPTMSEVSSFEPVAIQDFSGRVLHWLKEHCRNEGSSYVLIRGEEGTLRLYEATQDSPLEAFAYPIAMMYHRMAELILSQPTRDAAERRHAIGLLQKCCELLDPAKDIQVAIAAHKHLAALYSEMAAETIRNPKGGGGGGGGTVVLTQGMTILQMRSEAIVHIKAALVLNPNKNHNGQQELVEALTELFHVCLESYALKDCAATLVELQSILHLPKPLRHEVFSELLGDLYHHLVTSGTASAESDNLQHYIAKAIVASEPAPSGEFDVLRTLSPVSDSPEVNAQRALQYYQGAGTRTAVRKMGDLHNYMGQYYHAGHRFTKALESFDMARKAFLETNDVVNLSVVDINRANVHIKRAESARKEGDMGEEEASFLAAVEVLRTAEPSFPVRKHLAAVLLMFAMRLLALHAAELVELEERLSSLLEQASTLYQGLGDRQGYNQCLFHAATLHYGVLKLAPSRQHAERKETALAALMAVLEYYKGTDSTSTMIPRTRCAMALLTALPSPGHNGNHARAVQLRSSLEHVSALKAWFKFHLSGKHLAEPVLQEEVNRAIGIARDILRETVSITAGKAQLVAKASYRVALTSSNIVEILSVPVS